ncbi:MAG: FAD-dependent oxidoreductase [Candidatus Kapabacteria bacterium]|nr:FAD-dependent oxidoreductase [Candidatus Kapabacteria bacterium]
MGFTFLEIKMPTDYTSEGLKEKIAKEIGTLEFTHQIEKQSLDGRNSNNIHWIIRVGISSEAISTNEPFKPLKLEIPKINTNKKIVVIGSGPAGFFGAYVAKLAGFDVTIIEQGPEVFKRIADVRIFEKGGPLNERSNYAFGEGGAGTFSDGKLTCRSKHIPNERRFIFESFIKAGAPEEILYLAKPHVGSNILTKTARNLRKEFLDIGGKWHFGTKVIDISITNGKVTSIETEIGKIEADYFIFATGHSSYETYQMLLKNGVEFQLKPFAIGSRVEHYQERINQALWRKPELPGVKAADYALTFNDSPLPVYSFCMCPGGMVVSAPPSNGVNIVNGMSNYKRNYPFANSAIVTALKLDDFLNRPVSPLEALDWVTNLEKKFFEFANGFNAPSVKVSDFLKNKISTSFPETSYPFDLISADFKELFPNEIVNSLKLALTNFTTKIKGFEDGHLMGLESRTSSPVQVLREKSGLCNGFDNLYMAGEGSGYSGGIISSAADGIKSALDIVNKNL